MVKPSAIAGANMSKLNTDIAEVILKTGQVFGARLRIKYALDGRGAVDSPVQEVDVMQEIFDYSRAKRKLGPSGKR